MVVLRFGIYINLVVAGVYDGVYQNRVESQH